MADEDRDVLLLEQIAADVRAIRVSQKFQAGTAIALALAAAVSFIIALALNEALKRTFELIPVGKGLLGLWIYALIALGLGILFLWLIYTYLQPFLFRLFEPTQKQKS